MKILFIYSFYQGFQGGAMANLDILRRQFSARGHKVLIATTRADAGSDDPAVITLSKAISLIPQNVLKVGTSLTDLWMGLRIRKIVREHQPDLIHAYDDYILPAVLYAKPIGVPIVATMHQGLELNNDRAREWFPGVAILYRRRLRKNLECFTKISAVIAVSDYIRNWFIKKGYGLKNLERIYNCPPEWNYVDADQVFQPPVLLAAGRLCKNKGFRTLIEAVARLFQQGHKLKLNIYGAGPDREILHKSIGKLRLRDYISVKDPVSFGEMAEKYRTCDIVVFPSEIEETFGRISIEAMHMGKPVIASRIGAIPEMVEDGVTGILFPPGDAEALASAVGRLINNRDLCRRMGRSGRRILLKKANTEAIVGQHLELYRRVMCEN